MTSKAHNTTSDSGNVENKGYWSWIAVLVRPLSGNGHLVELFKITRQKGVSNLKKTVCEHVIKMRMI